MWKVIIVDDEVIVRRGLAHTIPWEKYGMTVVADYPNGQKAFEGFKEIMPDVVLTDIRMPKMDGLELLKSIRSRYPDTITLILSCHDDFEYAKSAITFGAVDYLLKTTMDEQEINRALTRVQQLLFERKNKLRQIENSKWFERQEELRTALTNPAAAMEGGRGRQWPTDGHYLLLAARAFHEDSSQLLFLKCKRLRELYGDEPELLCSVDSGAYLVLLLYVQGPISSTESQKLYQIWANRLQTVFSFKRDQLFVGAAAPVVSYSQLQKTFQQAISGMECFFYDEEAKLFYTQDAAAQILQSSESLFSPEERQMLLQAITDKAVHQVRTIVEKLMEKWRFGVHTHEIKAIAIVIIDILRSARKAQQGAFQSASQDIQTIYKLYQLKAKVMQEVQFWEKDQSAADDHKAVRPEIQKAMQFIQTHLANDLKMSTVADHVQLSRSHFSALFKQEAGKTFLEYVLEQRMEKVKEKLKYSRKKIYEAASEVGFSDYKYFTRCFKEYAGMTPKEWRESCQQRN